MQTAYYTHQASDEIPYYNENNYPGNYQYNMQEPAPSEATSGSRHKKKKKHREGESVDGDGSERRHRRHKKRNEDGDIPDGVEEGSSGRHHRKKRHHRDRQEENIEPTNGENNQLSGADRSFHPVDIGEVVATEYTFEDNPYSPRQEYEGTSPPGEYYHDENGDVESNVPYHPPGYETDNVNEHTYAHINRNGPNTDRQLWQDEDQIDFDAAYHQQDNQSWTNGEASVYPQETTIPPLNEDPSAGGAHLKKKTSGGGFGKFISSFRSKKKQNSTASEDAMANHEQWESNPQLFMPNVDSRMGTMDASMSKSATRARSSSRGKISRTSKAAHDLADVVLLDGDKLAIPISKKCTGDELLKKVCTELNIVETDYFGLTWTNNKVKTWFWLDFDKRIDKQLRHGEPWVFHFQVKFYPPEPNLILEDITRYQLCLQLRHDVYTGKLPCSWVTHALLGAYMVQSELGDYVPEVHDSQGLNYVREFEFFHKQNDELLAKIVELHKTLRNTPPDKADLKYLETAKRLEHYGIDLHPAWDSEDVQIFIGVSYHGVFVYKDRLRLSRFAWPKILRISFKKNFFYLKIRSDVHENVEGVIGFRLLTHNFAKRLWKTAIEHHTFFRLKEPKETTKSSPWLFSTLTFGSRHRFSGRTLHQHRTMSIERPHPQFDRTLSKRHTASMPTGLNQGDFQYGSMHSLNRAHPRDMTVGKTQSVEYLGPRRYGSSTQPLNEIGSPSNRGIMTRTHQEPFTSPIPSRGYISGEQQEQPPSGLMSPISQASTYRAIPQPPSQPYGSVSKRGGPPSVSEVSGVTDNSQRYRPQSAKRPGSGSAISGQSSRPGRPNATVTAVPTYVASSDLSYTEEPYANMPAPPEDLRYQDEYDDEML